MFTWTATIPLFCIESSLCNLIFIPQENKTQLEAKPKGHSSSQWQQKKKKKKAINKPLQMYWNNKAKSFILAIWILTQKMIDGKFSF